MENNTNLLKDINIIELGEVAELTLGSGIWRFEGYRSSSAKPPCYGN